MNGQNAADIRNRENEHGIADTMNTENNSSAADKGTRNIFLDGMMGLIVGDALGNPVQFMRRSELKRRGPVTGMESGGVFHTPAGTWTDDSSMALCSLDSIRQTGKIDLDDTMDRFIRWDRDGEYTPFGYAFDQGITCTEAIGSYERFHDAAACGRTGEYANGNGSLMRILPVCLYFADRCRNICTSDDFAIESIHRVGGLTHNHLRAKMACGLYYFIVKSIIYGKGSLNDRLQAGLDDGFRYYRRDLRNLTEMTHYARLYSLADFALVPEDEIRSSGYVVHTLEAAVWSLITTSSYQECELKAVNLADDADTVGAVAGGLAGLYYGYDNIPADWLGAIQRREWLESLMQ